MRTAYACLSPSLLCDDALLMRGRLTACIQFNPHDPLGILPRLGIWSRDSSGSENKRDTIARQGFGVASPHVVFIGSQLPSSEQLQKARKTLTHSKKARET